MERVQVKLALEETLKEVYSVILKDLSAYGGFPFFGIVVLTFFLVNLYDVAFSLAVSLLAVTAIVSAIRLVYFKPRPGMPRKKYSSIYERIDNSSFPSIHAARSVMLSIFFYSLVPQLLPVFVILTAAVFLSRIHFKRHDALDIAVGGILGLCLGYLLLLLTI